MTEEVATGMNRLKRGVSLIALATLVGCASQADMETVKRDNDELKNRLFRVEKELGGFKTEAKENIAKALQDIEGERGASRKGIADTQATMEGLKVDLQVLTGKVDDLAIASKRPADDLTLLKEDLARRMGELDERLTKLEKGVPASPKEAEKPTPEGLYQKGIDAYRAGNFTAARESLSAFLEKYPKHDLAANARYWNGETYYSEKKYEQAILEFQEVIKNFPGKEKVPSAIYKQAMAFIEIGDKKSARYLLNKLVEDHAASDEAKKARAKLKELK